MTSLIFCATDAGGARNVAPVAARAARLGLAMVVVASETTQPLFAEAGVAATLVADMDNLFTGHPTALVCGTARPGALETRMLAAAAAHGLRSVAVLDEWYGFRLRFCDAAGQLGVWPTIICCPDAVALAGAVAEGLPADVLVATGSPALAATADRIAAMAAAAPARPECWSDEQRPTLLFLSETHATDYGDGPGTRGPLGPWLGYCERDVRADLGAATATGRWSVVEKLHPSDRSQPPPPLPGPEVWQAQARVPLWPLLWHAGGVVGMRSMGLLEAAMMGHRPLSYQPNLLGRDDCTAVRLGLADSARSVDDVAAWLAAGPPPRSAPVRAACADPDAAGRILALALQS
jgi:hypothetical protein